MNRSTISKNIGLTAQVVGLAAILLALVLWAGLPLAAQQQKPANPQLPDPNSKSEQQPSATTPSGSQSTPGSSQGSGQYSSEANGQGQISSKNQQTFTGRVAHSGDRLVLNDSKSKTTYQLDRQDLAKQYEGKDVKVTGTLDTSDNTIRVSTIEPLSI
ncbi:MAG TPA: DUF5818 domain-containing protein [Terriglobales bacterium]|nr:DUF5818 domain-containing protein [Terriglobales bacterium]